MWELHSKFQPNEPKECANKIQPKNLLGTVERMSSENYAKRLSKFTVENQIPTKCIDNKISKNSGLLTWNKKAILWFFIPLQRMQQLGEMEIQGEHLQSGHSLMARELCGCTLLEPFFRGFGWNRITIPSMTKDALLIGFLAVLSFLLWLGEFTSFYSSYSLSSLLTNWRSLL